jgi:hypothetical protein
VRFFGEVLAKTTSLRGPLLLSYFFYVESEIKISQKHEGKGDRRGGKDRQKEKKEKEEKRKRKGERNKERKFSTVRCKVYTCTYKVVLNKSCVMVLMQSITFPINLINYSASGHHSTTSPYTLTKIWETFPQIWVKFDMDRVQSQALGTISPNMRKCANVQLYMEKYVLICGFAAYPLKSLKFCLMVYTSTYPHTYYHSCPPHYLHFKDSFPCLLA